MNDKEKIIYSRQITLPEVGLKGQEELEDTGILVVGMGGLGCPVAHYLISSGIGYLTIMDPDKVELSNLSRQPLYTEGDVGNLKVETAKQVLSHMNPNAVINALAEELTSENALTHASAHDFVIDCTDSERFEEARTELEKALAHPDLEKAPLLILGVFFNNKSNFKPCNKE